MMSRTSRLRHSTMDSQILVANLLCVAGRVGLETFRNMQC